MNSFTISQLQDYSGIKAHTIRIWEQRYNALTPHRSEGNTRYYDGEQLRRLLNIVSLLGPDHKVSQLCSLSDDELHMLLHAQDIALSKSASEADQTSVYIARLLASAMDFDESSFDKIFSNSVLRNGLRDTYITIIYPTLKRLGLLWSKDALPPAHEHFITNLIRTKIFTAIDALPPAKNNAKTWLLFLPEDEFHELGLLLAYYLIRQAGHKVFYLGANVPIASLEQTVSAIKPQHLLGFLVSKKNKENQLNAMKALAQAIPTTQVFIAINSNKTAKNIKQANLQILQSVDQLDLYLK